jgi:hypothetical protein
MAADWDGVDKSAHDVPFGGPRKSGYGDGGGDALRGRTARACGGIETSAAMLSLKWDGGRSFFFDVTVEGRGTGKWGRT